MELTPYVDAMRRDLSAATALADEPTRNVVERLGATLDTSARLAMFDALSTACAEISRELSPGAVEVRLAGRDPQFVVTSPPHPGPASLPTAPAAPLPPAAPVGPAAPTAPLPVAGGDATTSQPRTAEQPDADADGSDDDLDFDDADGGNARITLRLPRGLKARVESSASAAGVSVNTWLVDAVTAQLREERGHGRDERRNRRKGKRHGRGFDIDIDLPDFGAIGEDVARDVSRAMRDASRDIGRSVRKVPGTHISGWVR